MSATNDLFELCVKYATELAEEYCKGEENLKKAATEKAQRFAANMAENLPKVMEELAAKFIDIFRELADWIVACYDRLRLDEGPEDAEYDEDRKRQSFAFLCLFTYVWRCGVKLWKVNRAIYRPYAWLVALIRSYIIRV